jgi:vitamin B12 transporter
MCYVLNSARSYLCASSIFFVSIFGSAQTSIPEVNIVETQNGVNILDSNNSFETIGLLLSKTTGANLISSSPNGSVTIGLKGLSSNYTNLLWKGFITNSSTLGVADFSLSSSFLFTSARVNLGNSSLPVMGSLVELETISGKGKDNILEFNAVLGSYNNKIFGLKFQKKIGGILFGANAFIQNYKNDYKYQNSINNNEQRRINAGLKQFGSILYVRKNYLNSVLDFNYWCQSVYRQLPASITSKNSVAFQNDLLHRFTVNFTRSINKSWLGIGTAFFKDYQHFNDSASVLYPKYYFNKFQTFAKYYYVKDVGISYYGSGFVMVDYAKSPYYNGMVFRSIFSIDNKVAYSFRNSAFFVNVNTQVFKNKFYLLPGFLFQYQKGNIAVDFNIYAQKRFPTINDNYWQPGGNPNLKPETAFLGNFNFKLQKNLTKANFSFSHNLFYTIIDNQILWQPGIGGIWSPENIAKVRSIGGILNYQIDFNNKLRSSIMANFQLVNSINLTSFKYSIYTPITQGGLKMYNSFKTFKFGVELDYVGKRYILADNSQYLPWYILVGLNINKTFSLGSLRYNTSMNISNIFKTNYQVVAWYPMPLRLLTFSTKLVF